MGTDNGDSLENGENGHANGKRGSLPQLQGTKRGSIAVSTNSTKISRGVNQQHSVQGRKNSEWISDAELQHLKDQFELLDSDGNSSLEREEFILMGRRAGLPLVKMENLFLFLDKNGDGVIDFEEFVSGDVMNEIRAMISSQREQSRKEALAKERRTHVNVLKLLQVVRVKIENSARAYEFGAYLIFLLAYCAVVLMQRSPYQSLMLAASLNNYFIGSEYRVPYANELKGFMGIRTTEEFWDWHQIHFVELFYLGKYYNGDPYDKIDEGTILVHQRKTSGFRLMQRRAMNGSCWTSNMYERFQDSCYGYTFLDGMVGPVDEKPFLGAKSGMKYEFSRPSWFDSGYFENFGENKTEAKLHLQRLRDDLWLGQGTQFTRLDFVLYNPNVGQFAVVNLITEMTVTGLITPRVNIFARRYGYYQTNADWVRFACEIFVLIAWGYYVYSEYRKFRTAWKDQERVFAYFDVFWQQADAIHFTIFFICAILWLYIVADPSVTQLQVSEASILMDGGPVNFQATLQVVEVYFALSGVNMLFAVVRLLRFLRMNAFLGQLTDALEMMRDGLVQFLFVLVLVIFIFTLMGTVLFGATLLSFQQPIFALDTVLGYAMGFADPYELFELEPTGAVFFFYPFVFIMTLFVLPLTIAIIMDGYTAMQEMLERALKSNLAQAVTLTFPDQVYRGLVRALQLLVPNRAEHKRLKFPPKAEVLKLFSDCEEFEIMTIGELQKRFANKAITEEMLTAIIEHYDAFQADPDWLHLIAEETNLEAQQRIEVAQQENNDPALLSLICDELDVRLDQLINDQSVMERKLDLLLDIFPTSQLPQDY